MEGPYGIAVVDTGTSTVERTIGDVGTNICEVVRLIRKCNECYLSPVHINNVIEDFKAQNLLR